MKSVRTKLAGFALLGVFVVPGLMFQSSERIRAASPVTITVAFEEQGPVAGFQDPLRWNQIIPGIEAANPGITIKPEVIVASEGDYYTKVDLMMRSASTAPDLVKEDSFLVGSDATAGYLTPLNKYLATWPEYKTSSIRACSRSPRSRV